MLTLFAARAASANCARPVTYGAEVSDAGVYIEPQNFDGRVCPDKEGLVRENVATGEIVRIDTCEPDGGARYLDSCVAPGHYRYGFARPYECVPAACWTAYYVSVDVTDKPACAAPSHEKLPAAPWGADKEICSYNGRFLRVGLGALVVIATLIGATIFGVVRMRRRKRAS